MIRISDTGLSPSVDRLPRLFSYPILSWWLSEPRNARIPVWALSSSLAATKEIDFSFSSSPYLDVSVQEVPSVHLCIQCTVTEVCSAGFPHSEIHGSLNICFSPWLIAAYYVFLRLSVPRHPPCALLRFTYRNSFLSKIRLSVISLITDGFLDVLCC